MAILSSWARSLRPSGPTAAPGSVHLPPWYRACRSVRGRCNAYYVCVGLRKSFIAQGHQGVDACGTASGDEAGEQSDNREQTRHSGKSERVGGANAEKQRAQEPR